jgi:hypothetical protein
MSDAIWDVEKYPDLERRRKDWFYAMITWQYVWWFLIINIAGVSAFVASELSEMWGARPYAALWVSICSSILATLRPDARARTSREAWIVMELEIQRHSGCPKEIVEAFRKGEQIIGRGHFGTDHTTKWDPKPPR